MGLGPEPSPIPHTLRVGLASTTSKPEGGVVMGPLEIRWRCGNLLDDVAQC
ncbi:hypothetical protein HanIR_Chr07g0303071 [Helianthus annuus]|nr:hypothetical protein HanIR_Chr07g0303071 [Helianthus annuus]